MWILVFWGTREREKRLGYVADFCPVCRKIRAFEVTRVSTASHIYFIPLERGTFLEHRQKCRSCFTAFTSHLGRYRAVTPNLQGSMESLVTETFPSIHEVYRERLEIEERVKSGGSASDLELRKQMLMEVFHLAYPHFEEGIGTEGRRILARGLKPLEPTEDEVRECLQHFRQFRCRMGARLRTAEVMSSIRPEERKSVPGQYEY